MNRESQRLNSFVNWPASAPVDPERLAKAGFFYTGQGTEVECFSCGGKISQWNYTDQVMWRHQRMDPNCSFVASPFLSGNVPLGESPRTLPPLSHEGGDSTPPLENYEGDEGDELYKRDAVRLLTLVNWRDESVSRGDLVRAGFYHLGGGRLRCAYCTGELAPFRDLGSLGTPIQIHRMYFPNCSYARNVEMQIERREALARMNNLPIMQLPPSNGPMQPTININKPQSMGVEQNARVVAAGGQWRSLGVVGGGARHPEKAALATRLATFERWPADRAQVPRTLADAGFFYTGIEDQVRCFYCDGGLGKWEAGDTPWSEHARWFPHCGFVLLAKGQEFVDASRKQPQTAERTLKNRIRNLNLVNPVDEDQIGTSSTTWTSPDTPRASANFLEAKVEECMQDSAALAALSAGLDGARVRRAIVRRLRTTGTPFRSPEALIDAVLDDQLNEEGWSLWPRSELSQNLLTEAMFRDDPAYHAEVIEFEIPAPPPSSQVYSLHSTDRPDMATQDTPTTTTTTTTATITADIPATTIGTTTTAADHDEDKKPLSLEEENRQLKEARICKVCMDGEVSVVFLPCGHLVSCAGCGAALGACPLCRAPVRALVRAYLA